MYFSDGVRSVALAVVRVVTGLLFMQHGAQKLFGWLGGMGGPGQTVELFSLMGLAGVLEVFGGLMIVLGLLTQPVAIILVIEMLYAFFVVHLPQGGFPIQNGGELPLLYAAAFLLFAAWGAGRYSVDAMLGMAPKSGVAHVDPAPPETRRAA